MNFGFSLPLASKRITGGLSSPLCHSFVLCSPAHKRRAHLPIARRCLAANFLVNLTTGLSALATPAFFSVACNSIWQLEDRYGVTRPWAR